MSGERMWRIDDIAAHALTINRHHGISLPRYLTFSLRPRTFQWPSRSCVTPKFMASLRCKPSILKFRHLRPAPSRAICGQLRSSSSAAPQASTPTSSRPLPSFPCVAQHAARENRILSLRASSLSDRSDPSSSGPEPPYARPSPSSYKTYHHAQPLPLTYDEPLPEFDVAYETWGTLSPARDNAILLHTGLSASSHAASTLENPAPGWWEKFIGPGRALDTSQFFVICPNVLGGCYGSTGPSSIDPATGSPYATTFPVISIFDMVKAQFALLDHLGIKKLYASVGSSMGAMQSLAAGWMFPERVSKIVSISGTARSSPSSIAMRFAQRSGPSFQFHSP
jgi:alpha/beta hydrolase fold